MTWGTGRRCAPCGCRGRTSTCGISRLGRRRSSARRPARGASGRPARWWFSEGEKRFAFPTCEANPLVAALHEKAMPVILLPEDYDRWLEAEAKDAWALAQLFPFQLMAVN